MGGVLHVMVRRAAGIHKDKNKLGYEDCDSRGVLSETRSRPKTPQTEKRREEEKREETRR